ncbi:restriction endonuclease [Massilia varians]|uniref:restriction endonuclease n=1 Tax=Massilia varians TaxID=457921 RepID=UPI0025544B8E|nr:restriction endonuclease [Massilia varians]MDK6076469.1 restriction endonuclease [Massilia varians]
MARRSNEGLASDLVALPWQFSAVLAISAFFGIRWILPGFLPERGALSALKAHLDALSWIVFAALACMALLAALRAGIQGSKQAAGFRSSRQRARMRVVPDALPVSKPGAASLRAAPTTWSLDALRALEWKRFELLCARYYEAVGFTTATLAAGPDGGIDVKLFKVDPAKPLAIVQCKAWNTHPVGVKEVRELLGVMVHEGVGRGIFVTTGTYTPDALQFGAANPIQLLDGDAFVKKILDLPPEKQKALLDVAFEGDYRTPTCASCGTKMVARDSKRGAFWGCIYYPRCKTTLALRA